MNMDSYRFSNVPHLKFCNIKKLFVDKKVIDDIYFANDIFKYFAKLATNESDYKKLGKFYTESENNDLDNKCRNYIIDLFNEKEYFRNKSLKDIINLVKYFGKTKNLMIILELEQYDKDSKEVQKIIRIDNIDDIIF